MPQVEQKVTLIEYTPNPEEVIASSAKLCYSDLSISEIIEREKHKDTAKFIEKLLTMGHLSPIEHVSFTFGIEGVSRSLLAQITRHRIASFSVKSQRYVSASKNEQGFNYVVPPAIEQLGEDAKEKYKKQMQTMFEWYKDWQQQLGGESEKSNEDARFVLPNSAETKMIVTMNARELMHFFSIRCCQRAQWEIREVAWKMLELVSKVAPNLFKASGPSCIKTVCSEGVMTCKKSAFVKKKHAEMFNL